MKRIILSLLAGCLAVGSFAQNGNHQPYVNYWFPSTLLNWSAATDTAAPYNRGSVPLAARFIDTNSSPCPTSKNPGAKMMCLTIGNGSTSANPSQGYDHAGEYAFGFWQYVDYFVMWGGSAGEGLILAPNPTWIDAGHRNGVKVIGNIFMPPAQYGGQISWVNDLTQTDVNGNYPVADKLIEVANYYGFDGWFLNQETGGGSSATGTAIQNFMKYFQAHKPANMELIWYDAMLPSGSVGWQGALNTSNAPMFQDGSTVVSNDMFLDFRWTSSNSSLPNSNAEALSLGRDPFSLFAGVDVQANGYNTNVSWAKLFPTVTTPNVSVGLYIPSWTFHSSPDKNNIPLFYQREEKFWVGGNNTPCNTPTTGWRGWAKYYIEKSVVNGYPFVTRFNTGHGTNGFWVGGSQLSVKQWHNQSDQDILPTWRWVSESSGTPLAVDWDFTDAYNGGNSLKLSGDLNSANTTAVRLYNTKLAVSANTNLSITYKTGAAGASNMQVAVAFTDAPQTFFYLDCGNASSAGWETKNLSLSAYAGKTLCVIGLQCASTSDIANYAINIGEIAVADGTATTPAPASNVNLTSYTDCNNAELGVKWDTSSSSDVWYYDVYRTKPDNSLQWLGRTRNNAYYVKNIHRIDYETSTQVVVVAVNRSGMSSTQAVSTFVWPPNTTNYSVSLNGTTKYMDAGVVNLSGQAVTLESWVKVNNFKTTAPNISAVAGIDDTMQNVAALRIGNATIGNNKVQFALNVGGTVQTLTSATALTAGTWYHVAATYDGANMELYINGVQDATMAASGAVVANGAFHIGMDTTASATGYLDGAVDEVRAWTVARTQAQIADSKCFASALSNGLAASYTFDDCGAGTIAYDNSGNGHDATANNMTFADWLTATPCYQLAVANTPNVEGQVRLYPNPVTKGSSLVLELPDAAHATCSIYDVTGKLLYNQVTDKKTTTLSTDGFAKGVYIYRVEYNSHVYTGKVTIL